MNNQDKIAKKIAAQMKAANTLAELVKAWKDNEMEILLFPLERQEKAQNFYKEQMKRIKDA